MTDSETEGSDLACEHVKRKWGKKIDTNKQRYKAEYSSEDEEE